MAKTDGWKPEETRYQLDPTIYIGGNPDKHISDQTPVDLIEPLRAAWLTTKEKRPTDFNGLKVSVRRLSVIDGILETNAVITDYFSAWGLPKAEASQTLFDIHEKNVVVNRTSAPNAIFETRVPWAVASHNVLLDRNGRILMMVRSQAQGFHVGRVSVTEEEQMEPTQDFSPFAASFRSFHEELNLIVPPQSIRLLGVALEKGAAYPAYCFVAQTKELAKDVEVKWRKAKDYNENTALFAVEMTESDRWLTVDEITSDIWHKDLLAGNIPPDSKLKLHPTSPWRINLAKKFCEAQS